MELQNFAYGLGSYSVAPETDKAEQGTRMEAELLMSLCSSPVRFDKSGIKPISASESDASYVSDSSGSRRDTFTFVCPSFSLENPEMAMRRMKHNERVRKPTKAAEDDTTSKVDIPAPALLLKRPLKVDDRDAYRLSTEAMARNLSRSMQKALDWRLQTWVHTLSLAIVQKEKAMMKEGIPEAEVRTSLLRSSEARLITTLSNMKSYLQVTGAGTGFRVLPNQNDWAKEPISKKRRLSNGSECYEQLYTVTHELTFDGVVNIDTPAGKSEVLLQIPGTIEGTFLCSEDNGEKLQSVCVDVDTDFLAAMIEKSSRDMIRESLTKAVEESLNTFSEGEIVESMENQYVMHNSSPIPMNSTPFPPAAVQAALITPRMSSESSNSDTHHTKFLLPIPDDFNDSTPSRISPQPKSPAFGSPISHFTPQTPKSDVFNAAAALVSPTLKEPADYHDIRENSPSLPVLVEVACREFCSD